VRRTPLASIIATHCSTSPFAGVSGASTSTVSRQASMRYLKATSPPSSDSFCTPTSRRQRGAQIIVRRSDAEVGERVPMNVTDGYSGIASFGADAQAKPIYSDFCILG
jgi:hypothetical protein